MTIRSRSAMNGSFTLPAAWRISVPIRSCQ
jgi:hypothetical protein